MSLFSSLSLKFLRKCSGSIKDYEKENCWVSIEMTFWSWIQAGHNWVGEKWDSTTEEKQCWQVCFSVLDAELLRCNPSETHSAMTNKTQVKQFLTRWILFLVPEQGRELRTISWCTLQARGLGKWQNIWEPITHSEALGNKYLLNISDVQSTGHTQWEETEIWIKYWSLNKSTFTERPWDKRVSMT